MLRVLLVYREGIPVQLSHDGLRIPIDLWWGKPAPLELISAKNTGWEYTILIFYANGLCLKMESGSSLK